MKITNLKTILLKTKKRCMYLDLSLFDTTDESLDYLSAQIKDGNCIVVFKVNNISSKLALEFSFKIRQLTSLFSSLFLVEDRFDICKLSNADGVVLLNNSIDVKFAKKILDDDKLFAYFLSDEEQIDFLNYDFLILENKNLKKNVDKDIIYFTLENKNDNK